MKLLLDESVTHRFRHYFPGHDVRTAQYMGWSSKSNGELLALARDEFDILITVDHGIPNQQNITDADVAVMVLYAPSNDVEGLMPLVPQVLERVATAKRGNVIHIGRRSGQ
jgi:predicted nuclease of predicted toxin-antitoxin system